MDKKLIEQLKKVLENEKADTEEQLGRFAKKDDKLPDDWDTVFPKHSGGESGGSALEKSADEVEEYSTLLPIEHSLELRLKNINSALEKIKKGKYGKCEKCQKQILIDRLKVSPEAPFCLNCKQ